MIETMEKTKRVFVEEKELYINPKIALIISIARLNGFSNIIYDFFKEVDYNENDLIITKNNEYINNKDFKIMFKNNFPNIWECHHNLKSCCSVKKLFYQRLLNDNWQLITQDDEIDNINLISNLIYTTEHNMKMIKTHKEEKEEMPIIREQVKNINDDEINITINDLIKEGLEIEEKNLENNEKELQFKVGDIFSFKHDKIISENFMNKILLFSNDPTQPIENWVKGELVNIMTRIFSNDRICKKIFRSNNSRKRYQYIQLCEKTFQDISNSQEEEFIPKYYSGLDANKEEVINLLNCKVEFSDDLETWKKSTLNVIKEHRYYDNNSFGWIYIRTVKEKEYYNIPAATLPKPIINISEIKGDFYKLNIPGKSYSKNGWHTTDTETGIIDDLLFHKESDAQEWVNWLKTWETKSK